MKYADFLSTMKACPFCEPVALSNTKILENDAAYLTFSIAPYHKDHLLVVPKRHVTDMLEISHDEIHDIDDLERKALKIMRGLGYKNISILVREGSGTGQSVAHIHYHVVPDVILSNVDSAGVDRRVMTDDEIQDLLKRVEAVK